MKKQLKLILGASVVVLAIAITGAWAFRPTAEAAAAIVTGRTTVAEASRAALRVEWQSGGLQHGIGHSGGLQHGIGHSGDDTFLADALGITAAELQTAKEEARTAAIEQAVEDGLLTREQADELLLNGGRGFHGLGGHGRFGFSVGIDYDSFLADALGITTEELQSARQEAREAAIADALAEGQITEEQAELLRAQAAVKEAIDAGSLAAGVLGMTVEELQQALVDGETPAAIIEEAGLTVAEFRTALNEAYQAEIQELVDGGVITQEQADQILSSGLGGGCGFGGFGRFGGSGFFRGPGFFRAPVTPETSSSDA